MRKIINCLKFIKESKGYIYGTSFLFFFFAIIGFYFPLMEEQIMRIILELQEMFEGLNLWETISLIFFNNSRASLTAIISGISFGIIPLMIIFSNGYLIGFVSNLVARESSIFELWRLLPHGILEIPAVLISLGMGLKLGVKLLRKPNKKEFFSDLNSSLRTFVLIILPLLVVAAIIEGLLIFYFS
jgi:stage II sporulation protein M